MIYVTMMEVETDLSLYNASICKWKLKDFFHTLLLTNFFFSWNFSQIVSDDYNPNFTNDSFS